MKTNIVAIQKKSFALIVGLAILIANLSQSGVNIASTQRSQERMVRERAMDRIVHIEDGIILDIPQVLLIVTSDMDVVVGKVVIAPLDS